MRGVRLKSADFGDDYNMMVLDRAARRHCKRSEAIHSRIATLRADCFVATLVEMTASEYILNHYVLKTLAALGANA